MTSYTLKKENQNEKAVYKQWLILFIEINAKSKLPLLSCLMRHGNKIVTGYLDPSRSAHRQKCAPIPASIVVEILIYGAIQLYKHYYNHSQEDTSNFTNTD